MVEGAPFEEKFVGPQLDILEPAVGDPAEARANAVRREVSLLCLVHDDEGGFAVVDNVKFMLVERGEAAV